MSKNNGFGKFVAGVMIGAAAGVLLAPDSGAETRKKLKVKFDDLVEKIKDLDAEDVKKSLINKVNEIKAELADLDKEKVISIAKDKADKIATKLDALYKEAKEKATPAIEKAVEELRVNTVKVLKATVKKLDTPKEVVKEEPKKVTKK